ncbi:MAG TPA: tetratricopeptide repeat protein [Verrucomicrobiae bacterium]|nr:tetratricopeptide repeat protein [Verrucomicrobiae bacterium]
MTGAKSPLESSAVAEATPAPPRWRTVLGATLIVLAALAVYYNSFAVPFLMDDASSIEENRTIRHLWPIWNVLSPSPSSFTGGRPVVNLSLAVNHALSGNRVWGYHAFNLGAHILAGLALFGIVRRTLLRPGLRERFDASAAWVALAIALIWTVHPLHTEAVTYISERCESLAGMFYLLTLYAFLRGAESQKSTAWFVLSVAACFLGMGSKEVMVTAPAMVLIYDTIFISGSLREAWARHRYLYLGLASSWLFLRHLMAGLDNRGAGYGLGVGWWSYALVECQGIVHYLRLALWPHPLVFDYGEYVPAQHLAAIAPCALILAALAGGVLFALKRCRMVGFLGIWFLGILAPTSSVVPILGSPVAEHRMYLPLASVVALIVVGAVVLGRRLSPQPRRRMVLGCAAGAFLVGLLGLVTIQRNRDYKSVLSIWQDTVEKCPNNARALYNLGVVLIQQGRLEDGLQQYERALKIKPDYAEVHYNMGAALAQAGRVAEAIQHYRQALRIRPDFADARSNLGIALAGLGRLQEAIDEYEQALRTDPDHAEAHYNLALALMQKGEVRAAISHYEQALQIKPDFAEAHNNLGNAMLRAGMIQDAIGQYEQALRINPRYAEAHNNLGLALIQLGGRQEAIRHWRSALRINPDYADAHFNLGVALEQEGSMQDAISEYEQAVRLKPDFAQAETNLARARAAQ